MKKGLVFAVAMMSLLFSACTSCGNKEKKPMNVKSASETFAVNPEIDTNKADTAEVANQVYKFIDCLKNKDVDQALSLLYYLDKEQIKPLPESLKKRERTTLATVAGAVDYKLENLQFLKETDNEVRIIVTLFEKDAKDPAPNTMKIRVQPVRRDGAWYLTLADTQYDSTHGSDIQN